MLSALYDIIITPLIYLTEFFYELMYEITDNEGVSVIGLSFVVTFATLPLYMIAERWQEKERNIQSKLKSGIERIKTTFKGDEQYMILNAYYKENHYHPIMALRSSFSLLIQIPFFMAAYNFLSNLEPLNEYSFLFIKSFGAPDATFKIGGFAINVLPISMTIINCVAGAIYSKGHPLSEKIQIYACALVFLLLLYDSPAGLVVYWTMNNILSLIKNIFYKIKNPTKVLYIIACIFSLVCLYETIFVLKNTKFIFRIAIAVFSFIIPIIPFFAKKFDSFITNSFKILDKEPKLRISLFIISAITIIILSGLAIPTILIQSEPEQYSFIDGYKSPFVFIVPVFSQAVGFFLFWPLCFYALFSSKTKKTLTIIFSIIAFVGTLNCFAFSGEYGAIGADLVFLTPQQFTVTVPDFIFNFIAVLFLSATVFIFLKAKPKILHSLCAILALSLGTISIKNIVQIQLAYSNMEVPVVKDKPDSVFHLSKTGKNVIVIMQDRMFSPFIKYFLEEKPELYEKYDGWTFYPNTISFATSTMLGTPGIFGGYDYTPFEMNRRDTETLQKKHNQACVSMPIVFNNAGWDTTVADLPYENYLEQPVEQMYEPYPFINRVTTHGIYSDVWYKKHNMKPTPYLSTQIRRNFIWFSFFKMVSPILRPIVYHNEYWLAWNKFDNTAKFIDNYSEIEFLPELMDTSSEKNTFFLLDNEATHEPIYLQAPNYEPVEKVTNIGPGKYADNTQYHTVAGIMMRFAEFIDWLKANGVYDNTRIIIVSDHGKGIRIDDFEDEDWAPWVKEQIVATLLVKDFNSHGPLKTDPTFMTNADTPSIATKDIIENAKNPFTNSVFEIEDKNGWIKIPAAPPESTRIRNNTKFHIADDHWYTVKDDIYVNSNWGKYDMQTGKHIYFDNTEKQTR